MRCSCCNKNLNDYESTLKDAEGTFLDTCNKCLKGLGIHKVGRADFEQYAEPPEDEGFDLDEEDLQELEDDEE